VACNFDHAGGLPVFCKFCGGAVAEGAYFCPVCGKDISGTLPSSLQTAIMVPPRTSGMAIGSLVCGLFLFFFPLSLVAVILGHLSLSEIRKSAGRLAGQGMAIAGLVLGYMGLASLPIVLIIAAIAIPNLLRARIAANEASAAGGVRTLNVAEVSYAQSHAASGFTCSLTDLHDAGLIDEKLTSATRYGYRFRIDGCGGRTGGPVTQYQISAFPVKFNQSGVRQFCSDESGVIKSSKNSRQDCMESGAPL
jgi:type IV pilus assembly protein PilA